MRKLFLFLLTAAIGFSQINVTSADYVQQGKLTAVADAGANDTYTGCPTVAVRAYATGMELAFKPNTVNTGAASLNVCTLGAKSIKTVAGADPSDGDLAAGKWYKLVYDGTNFQIVGGVGSGTSLPTQTSNADKALMTDGSTTSWNRFLKSLAVSSDFGLTCSGGADSASGNCTISAGANIPLLDDNNAFAGITSFPSSATQTISATTSVILCDATRVKIQSTTTTYTLSGVATIADATADGTVCIVQNIGSYAITLTNGSTQNLKLGASTVAISAGQAITLIWDSSTSLWVQEVSASTSSGGTITLLGSGGGTTTVAVGTEPASGAANQTFSVTIPASSLNNRYNNVQCDAVLPQQTVTTADSALNTRIYINSTLVGSTYTDTASDTSMTMSYLLRSLADNSLWSQLLTWRSSGTAANTSPQNPTATLTSDITLEFRFWMTGGDDTFTLSQWSCFLRSF